MTTKELIKKLEDKSPFAIAWAFLWRAWVLSIGAYLLFLVVLLALASLFSLLAL